MNTSAKQKSAHKVIQDKTSALVQYNDVQNAVQHNGAHKVMQNK